MTPLFKVLYRFYRLSSGGWYWAQRRFTRPGLAVLGALILAALLAPDTDNNVTYQALPLLLFLLVVAVCWGRGFKARFAATRLLPRFGTAGCPLDYRIVVKNLSSKTQSGLTLLENLADPRPSFEDFVARELAEQKALRSFRFSESQRTTPLRLATVKEASVPPAAPNEEAEVRVELTPLRRGVLRFTGVTLARPDPLGLVRALSTVPLPQTVLILPRRYSLPAMALPGTAKYQERGVALAASVGQSEEYVALRDYRQGDPLRHIHWRSWARVGRPVVKEFEDEFFVRHALVLDTFSRPPHSEVFEEAVSVAASFACTLPTQESLLDLLFVGPQSYCFTAGRGVAHVEQMLEILASVRACTDQPFRALEHLVLSHIEVVSGCICVLVAWDEARRSLIGKLRALGVPVWVLVLVPPGESQSLEPGPLRDEPDRFSVLEIGQVEAGLAKLK
ncbi:MAG: DUF58 domain-containing protein [Verrucomicrobiota bacterium]|jgi:uncharacterized protein (DUF58 family)